jgi:hypothetical protein
MTEHMLSLFLGPKAGNGKPVWKDANQKQDRGMTAIRRLHSIPVIVIR